MKRKYCKLLGVEEAPTNSELLEEFKAQKIKNKDILRLLRRRQIRTLSGVAAIAVLTKPYKCPGKCVYCPTEKKVPKSYLSNEPAVMRAIRCNFEPHKQVQMRLRALQNNGHAIDKLELIVIGGTWSYLPAEYQFWFIKECFRAANDFKEIKKLRNKEIKGVKVEKIEKLKRDLINEQRKNEKVKCRVVGLTLETRPDYINEKELEKMRLLGATRVEIGVQQIDDKILRLNQRGHGVEETIRATALLRAYGFKITYHLMLNLPGSTPAKDLKMFKKIFSDPRFMPDQIKIYPCVVARGAKIYSWWQEGKWRAYSESQLVKLIINIKKMTPAWVRIIRVIRDIPEESIMAGNKITNLRQTIAKEMNKQGLACQCIRCREAGHHGKITNDKFQISNKIQNSKLKKLLLVSRRYEVVGGEEYFLSYESRDKKILYAFCRLFLPKTGSAIIRELHTYGELMPLGARGKVQHTGLGKQLLKVAEETVKKHNYKELQIISGIGVRPYYRKLGYRLRNTYMVKKFNKKAIF